MNLLSSLPWTSIIIAIITFFFSKKSGKTDAEAALLSVGAGIGSYYLFDPANTDNLFGVGVDDSQAGNPLPEVDAASSGGDPSGWGDVVSGAVDTAGEVLVEWGPTGTAGVIATGALASDKSYWPWIIGLGAFFLLTR
jgi:hypothetical protein